MGDGYSRGLVPQPDGRSVLVLSAAHNGSGLTPVYHSIVELGGGTGGANQRWSRQ